MSTRPDARVPAGCLHCGATSTLRHLAPGGRLCDRCYRQSRAEPCSRCGRTRIVHTRIAAGPLCSSCSAARKPHQPCGSCGNLRAVMGRRSDGAPLCKACRPTPRRACAVCARVTKAVARTPDGPICDRCYSAPPRPCGSCGRSQTIKRRATGGEPDLCGTCVNRPLTSCAACGLVRRCDDRARQPFCLPCLALAQTSTETGLQPAGPGQFPSRHPGLACTTCGATSGLIRKGTCSRCYTTRRLHDVLADPHLGIPAQLQPLITALASWNHSNSVSEWLQRPGGLLLLQLAHHAHDEPITHQLLDTLPPNRHLTNLRGVLVASGVLPERAEPLERIEPWLDQLLDDQPTPHHALIRQFALWHVLRRARRRAKQRTLTLGAAGTIRAQIRAALDFLAWLDQHDKILADLDQNDIDRWLTSTAPNRYRLQAFLAWTRQRHLTTRLTIPKQPRSQPGQFLPEPDHWKLLSRCLHDPTLPLDVRTAGALLLLYGQFPARLTQLTTQHIHRQDHDTYLTLGATPVLLPPKLATLVHAQTQAGHHRASPDQTHRPLFPGQPPARPVSEHTLAERLRRHHIPPRPARHTALTGLAADLPAPVLADLLGLHIHTATKWTKLTNHDWTSYIAQRAKEHHHDHPTNTNTAPIE